VRWLPDDEAAVKHALKLVVKAAVLWRIPKAKILADVALDLSTRAAGTPNLLAAAVGAFIVKMAETVREKARDRLGPEPAPPGPSEHKPLAKRFQLAYEQYRAAIDFDPSLAGKSRRMVYTAIKRRASGTGKELPDFTTFSRYLREALRFHEPPPITGAD
jgi:hypothetical protein